MILKFRYEYSDLVEPISIVNNLNDHIKSYKHITNDRDLLRMRESLSDRGYLIYYIEDMEDSSIITIDTDVYKWIGDDSNVGKEITRFMRNYNIKQIENSIEL